MREYECDSGGVVGVLRVVVDWRCLTVTDRRETAADCESKPDVRARPLVLEIVCNYSLDIVRNRLIYCSAKWNVST